MLTDDEIYAMYNEPRSDAEMLEFARELIAAHTTKLLAAVEMPEPAGCVWCDYGDLDGAVIRPKGYYTRTQESPLYTADQLQQYAAAAAAQARMKALDEAKQAINDLALYGNDERRNWQVATIGDCAAAIEKLKGGE